MKISIFCIFLTLFSSCKTRQPRPLMAKPEKENSFSIIEQRKYSYGLNPTFLKDNKTAVVYFGSFPKMPPQPGATRSIKYIPFEGTSRTVYVDTKKSNWQSLDEFDRYHVILNKELMEVGSSVADQSFNLSVNSPNSSDQQTIYIVAGVVSGVIGIGLGAYFFNQGRKLSKLSNTSPKKMTNGTPLSPIRQADEATPPKTRNAADKSSSIKSRSTQGNQKGSGDLVAQTSAIRTVGDSEVSGLDPSDSLRSLTTTKSQETIQADLNSPRRDIVTTQNKQISEETWGEWLKNAPQRTAEWAKENPGKCALGVGAIVAAAALATCGLPDFSIFYDFAGLNNPKNTDLVLSTTNSLQEILSSSTSSSAATATSNAVSAVSDATVKAVTAKGVATGTDLLTAGSDIATRSTALETVSNVPAMTLDNVIKFFSENIPFSYNPDLTTLQKLEYTSDILTKHATEVPPGIWLMLNNALEVARRGADLPTSLSK